MFRAAAQRAGCGDRAAVAVTQLDAGAVERGLLAAPASVPSFSAAVALVDKIRFYAGGPPHGHPLNPRISLAGCHWVAPPPPASRSSAGHLCLFVLTTAACGKDAVCNHLDDEK